MSLPLTPTQQLKEAGQSLWLDNITRELLTSGTLARYINDWSVTGLTSNPTIYNKALQGSGAYDQQIREGVAAGQGTEALFFDLALRDLREAADLLRPIYTRTAGVDGWVSLEVSPLLARDPAATLEVARSLHASAERPNLMIKIPGTIEGLGAIEAAIFAGIPVNVTLLFSTEHYLAAAEAYLRGIERRIGAGLNPDVASVASLFVSRWDAAVTGRVPAALANRVGIAVATRAYRAYVDTISSKRWQRALNAGARPQRLLFASTGTKEAGLSESLYVEALAAPLTVNTIPEKTLKAFAAQGVIGTTLPADGGDCDAVLTEAARASIDLAALAGKLQDEGAASFVASWRELLAVIAGKSGR